MLDINAIIHGTYMRDQTKVEMRRSPHEHTAL